jgi:hypothetical protein
MIEALRQAKPKRGLKRRTAAGSAMVPESLRIINWSAPIGWSSLNVNAWSASGLSASCFLARADGSAARYAV